MKLDWSALAVEDREAIFAYIEAESPRAAVAIDDRIAEQIRRLIEFPEKGRPGRIEGTRELVIGQTPYVAAYRVEGDRVTVLRVLHGALLWPGEMP